ncbi:MAG: TIM barrel protein [bacterium]
MGRAREFCLDSLTEICRYAAAKQVTSVLEPLAPEESPLINALPARREAFSLTEQYGAEAMAALAPLGLNGETLDEFFAACGESLQVIHCIDCDGTAARHLVPGEGSLDFPALAQSLRFHNLLNALSLEPSPAYHSEPMAALIRAKDCLLNMFGDAITL